MHTIRRTALAVLLVACGIGFASPRIAAADDYPNRRVTLLVAAAAGGYAALSRALSASSFRRSSVRASSLKIAEAPGEISRRRPSRVLRPMATPFS